jgi:hypothetical protein
VPSSTFSIRPMDELDSVGIDVAVDDVLFNLVTKDTQLMRGSTPWRGGREKDPVLLQLLLSPPLTSATLFLIALHPQVLNFLLSSLSWPFQFLL